MIKDLIPIYDKNELYNLPISDIDGRIIGAFEYPKATIQETLLFYHKLKNPVELLWELKKKYFKPKIKSEVEIDRILLNSLDWIITQLINSRFKRGLSSYEKAPKMTQKHKERKTTRWANIQVVCKAFNLSLTDLLNNYTMEQLDRMSDQVCFYNYEMNEDTQKINDWVWNNEDTSWINKKELLKKHKESKKRKVVSSEILQYKQF